MACAAAPTILSKPQSPAVFSVLSSSRLVLSTPRSTTLFPSRKSRNYSHFSSRRPFAAVPQALAEEEEEEEVAIGDCIVYEEGAFDDPFLHTMRDFRSEDVPVRKRVSNRRDKDVPIPTDVLIPEEWLNVQRELNMTKKERRSLSRELEFGRRVEKRRAELRPINLEEFEKIKREKLKQLKPIVLDNPQFGNAGENRKEEGKGDDRIDGDGVVGGRAVARNPRLAVYGGGLEDISAVFNSGNYDPAAAGKPQGSRKLFSKEEKILLNKRIPNLDVSMSGKWHPLHSLAASGEFYLLNALLKHNLDINAPAKNELRAIHNAILGKKQAVFNFLLRESANPFVRDQDGATLMHYAVLAASDQMIKILLLYNVDINLQDNDGWTALHLAIQSRRTDIVRLLLIKGADKSLKNKDGLTALDLCLYSGRDKRTYELIRLLKRFR